MMATGRPNREIRGHANYEGVHRERQKHVAAQLFEAAGIPWDDKAKRMDWTMRGFRQFDAPVSVIGCIDRNLEDSTEAYFDLGQFVYGMVLAAGTAVSDASSTARASSQSPVVRSTRRSPTTS
ncbi:MAG: hypothetical protein R2713_14880 [Ilumatobacteraceae bacterium]